MANTEKIRIAYVGQALADGSMDIADLAPALLALGNLAKRANTVIGNKQPVQVLLKSDEIRRGSFDITLLLNCDILEQAKMLMGMAEDTGLKALTDVLGMCINAKEGIFWLIQAIGFRKILKAEPKGDTINITLNDNTVINVNNNVYKVYTDHEARGYVEKVIAPIKKDGIDSFEFRNPANNDDKAPLFSVSKDEAPLFKTPSLETRVEPDNIFEQTILLKIVTVNFNEDQKWRFSDGEAVFWAKIEDEDFWEKVNSRELVFGSGDKLRVKCTVVQSLSANNELVSVRTITKVERIVPKPTQIKLDF